MNPANTSTMETYHGHVRTPSDAIILFEACRLGLLPRVQRRLSEKERQSIKSGSVFVWDEREAGMRRWTDGKSWSASRVSGSFLTYREMEGKRGGGNTFAPPVTTIGRKSPNGDSDSDHGMDLEGPDGYRYKPDGLMKQSFSITTATHQKLHLISYYARSHPSSSNLINPSHDPSLKHIRPVKGMYPESTVHEPQNVPNISHRPVLTTSFNAHHPSSPLSVNSYNGWLPSPTSTPPGNLSAMPPQHYSQGQLPAPVTNGNGAPMQQYERANYGPQSSPMQVEVSCHSTPHMGSIPSPMMHLRPNQHSQQSSPRMCQEVPLQRQHSAPLPLAPPPLDNSNSIRYGSPGASSHTSARTPPRTAEGWDVNLIRGSPETRDCSLMPGEMSPGGTKLLDVQDIPNDKLRLQDDVKTLRLLDKSFI